MKRKRSLNWLFVVVGLMIVMIVGLVAYIAYLQFAPVSDDMPEYLLDDDGITEIEPPLPVSSFQLTNQSGELLDIQDLSGELTLVTFGFTHCPDVCPITLGEMRNIYDDLGNAAEDVNFVFVSVDGERDTPDVLSTYFATLRVDNFVTGLTGTDAETASIREPLGIEVIRHEPDRLGNYSVDHTAGMFLLDGENNWLRRYRYGTRSNIIADDIRAVLVSN